MLAFCPAVYGRSQRLLGMLIARAVVLQSENHRFSFILNSRPATIFRP
jgi:hypothetical protein